tara:strand:- start:747 stop:1352 length:606 start_codon:yes stop_codon:yes gene_type:complete
MKSLVIAIFCVVAVFSNHAVAEETTPDIETLKRAQEAAQTLMLSDEMRVLQYFPELPPLPLDIKVTHANYTPPQINLGRGRSLACSALLCAVGIAIPESHSECVQVLRDWAIYLATLSWFRSTPKCPIINAQGTVTGYNEVSCDSIQDVNMRQTCYDANNQRPRPPIPPRNPCDHLTGLEYELCRIEQCNSQNNEQFCQIR